MGGVGGTLAGNPVSRAATRATLKAVLTDATFAGMTEAEDEPADFLMNRGLTTQTIMDDVARHHEVFDAALGELSAGARPTG